MSKASSKLEDSPPHSQDQGEGWPARFEWLLKHRHAGNRSSLARALGLVPTQVSNLLAGAVPGGETLREAVRSHADINPEWLLTGRGPRERPPTPDIAQRTLQDIEARIAHAREEQAKLNAEPADGTDAANRAYVAAKAEAGKERRSRGRKRKGGSKADDESA